MPLITSQQLKQLSVKQLPGVCEEIREKLISDVTESGGHLASNLGAVELSVALHFVFGEKDKIVWDVGHQCYTHKILTGRTDFTTLRKQGGLSGFPDFVEDPSDNFTVGHAGTAISQALGLAKARDINGEDYSVVAGDKRTYLRGVEQRKRHAPYCRGQRQQYEHFAVGWYKHA